MIWRAYAGLSGAVVLSVVSLAVVMGVPEKWIMQLAIGTSAVMLGNAMLVTLFVAALRRRKP